MSQGAGLFLALTTSHRSLTRAPNGVQGQTAQLPPAAVGRGCLHTAAQGQCPESRTLRDSGLEAAPPDGGWGRWALSGGWVGGRRTRAHTCHHQELCIWRPTFIYNSKIDVGVHMCICVHSVYMCVCTHIGTHQCLCTYVCTFTPTHIYVHHGSVCACCRCVGMHVHARICVHVCACTHTCLCAHTQCVHTHASMYM